MFVPLPIAGAPAEGQVATAVHSVLVRPQLPLPASAECPLCRGAMDTEAQLKEVQQQICGLQPASYEEDVGGRGLVSLGMMSSLFSDIRRV